MKMWCLTLFVHLFLRACVCSALCMCSKLANLYTFTIISIFFLLLARFLTHHINTNTFNIIELTSTQIYFWTVIEFHRFWLRVFFSILHDHFRIIANCDKFLRLLPAMEMVFSFVLLSLYKIKMIWFICAWIEDKKCALI